MKSVRQGVMKDTVVSASGMLYIRSVPLSVDTTMNEKMKPNIQMVVLPPCVLVNAL